MATEIVNHPQHYQTESGIEAIEVMERYGLGPHLFIAMKHLLRAGKKGGVLTDLKKADWYISRMLAQHALPMFSGGDWRETTWHRPPAIVTAFGLEGNHAAAVQWILTAAGEAHEATRFSCMDAALVYLKAAIAEAEAAAA